MDRYSVYDQSVELAALQAVVADLRAADPSLQVYLFGSRNGERYRQDSDWDLVAVSNAFADVSFLRRAQSLSLTLAKRGFANVDLVCLSPEEFAHKKKEGSALSPAFAQARSL